MNIFLVRHTEYANPTNIFPYRLPVPLTEVGRQKAIDIGQWFVDRGFSKTPIITSPIARTKETAELIASKTQSEITIDDDLIELWSKLQGTPLPANGSWSACYELGVQEEIESIQTRMRRIFDKAISRNQDSILISHGDPIMALYYQLQGKNLPRVIDSIPDYIGKGDVIQVALRSGCQMTFNRYKIE